MSKQRIHNEYFRKVFVKTVHGYKTRPKELIDEILERDPVPTNYVTEEPWTREELEKPYSTIVGYESRRKSCPTCGEKLSEGEWIWSWGEYVYGKWHTVKHFCKQCYRREVLPLLTSHRDECGCDFSLIGYRGEVLPEWLVLEESYNVPNQ